MSSIMQPDQQLDVFRLLRNMSGHLENVRDDDGVLRFCLRATRDFFRAEDACLARLRHGNALADIVYEVPKDSEWDRVLLASFLRAERPRVPFDHLIVPLWRTSERSCHVILCRRLSPLKASELVSSYPVRTLSDRSAISTFTDPPGPHAALMTNSVPLVIIGRV